MWTGASEFVPGDVTVVRMAEGKQPKVVWDGVKRIPVCASSQWNTWSCGPKLGKPAPTTTTATNRGHLATSVWSPHARCDLHVDSDVRLSVCVVVRTSVHVRVGTAVHESV